MKVVVNRCFGGFSLSQKAIMEYAKRKGWTLYPAHSEVVTDGGGKTHMVVTGGDDEWITFYLRVPVEEYNNMTQEQQNEAFFSDHRISRDDPDLVAVVEQLGSERKTGASGRFAHLEVVEIPDGIEWTIDEYDGSETVEEVHRSW
jgi:hypothetical protein